MTTHIHLIRHGETNWNAEGRIQGQSESELTAQGRAQARELRNNLTLAAFDAFYCSSNLRTRQTIGELLDGMVDPVHFMDELREIHLGPWETVLKTQIARDYPREFEDFWKYPHQFDLTGAETFYSLQQRGLAVMDQILEACLDQTVMVVSHGAIIKSILCHFEGRPLSELWEPPRMYNCAHSIVAFNGNGEARITQYAGLETW